MQRIQLATLLLVAVLFLGCKTIPASGEGDGVPVINHNTEEIPSEDVIPEEGGDAEYQQQQQQQQQQPNSEDQDDEQQRSDNNNHSSDKCAWGTACHHEQHGHEEENIDYRQQKQDQEQAGNKAGGNEHLYSQDEIPEVPMEKNASSPSTTASGEKMHGNNGNTAAGGHLPFVHHHGHAASHFIPPEGFAITARVYTDPNDKLAHFTDDIEGAHITLPYWECGATGSTTSPLPVKHAYFRHALSGSKPNVWSGTEYGPHPQLVVALKRMEMTLNSGETKQLKPGDVVLLEDVVSGGHKLTSLENEFDMTYLLLTLPQHYHHVGKDRFSLKQASTNKQKSPCSNNWNLNDAGASSGGAFVNKADNTRQQTHQVSSSSSSSFAWDAATAGDIAAATPLKEARTRKLILGAVGVSLSTLVADFLGKVAPLWVAVGIGGTCFVVGGTAAVIKGGDYVLEELEMWQERKRLDAPVDQGEEDENEEESERQEGGAEEQTASATS